MINKKSHTEAKYMYWD